MISQSPQGTQRTQDDAAAVRDMLLLSGGAALMVLGAGLLLSHPLVRRTVGANLPSLLPQLPDQLRGGVGAMMPDLERYLRLRNM